MTIENLGRLERVELRDCWPSGASDFARWLTRKETIADLGKTLGICLELETQQWQAGSLPAEFICKDTGTDRWVLIENQLEWTDHGDLGKLLTSASGLEAATFVWVAARFTEQHRSTLDWLNRITDYHFRFFGLEVELWRIGTSPAAPKFTIVSKPEDWSPSGAQPASAIQDPEPTETRVAQRPSDWSFFSAQAAPKIADPEPDETRVAQRLSDWSSFAEQTAPTIADPEPAETQVAQRPEDWSPSGAQPASAIQDPEPAESRIAPEPSDWSSFPEQTAPAIEDPEPAENRVAQRPSEWFSFPEQAEPTIADPEPAENRVAQRLSEWFSFAKQTAPTIGDPEPAENRVAQRPSEWSSFASQTAPAIEDPEPAETQKMQRAYWTAFDKVLRASDGPVGGGKKPQPQSWMAYSVGRSHFLLMATMLRLNRRVRAELYISGEKAKAHFHMLKGKREQIEADLGYALDWEEMPAEKNSRVSISLNVANPENEADWPRQHRWLAQHLNEMHRALLPWIATVDDLATLAAEKEEVVKAAKDSGLSTRAFAVYWGLKDDVVLRNAGIAARELAQETESLLELYPDARVDADEQHKLRASLGRLLLGLDKKERVRVVDIVLAILLDDGAKVEAQGGFRDHPVNEVRGAPLVLPRAS
jgi:Domain of unknown function (DUF4268)